MRTFTIICSQDELPDDVIKSRDNEMGGNQIGHNMERWMAAVLQRANTAYGEKWDELHEP